MPLTGGLRDRMIHESIFRAVQGFLQVNNWLDPGRQHATITLVDEYPDDDAEVPLNTVAVSVGDSNQYLLELGSKAETHTTVVYVDFYADGESLGKHVIGDIYAFINENPVIAVYDWSLATPTTDFSVEVVEGSVEKSRPARAVNMWQRHWHSMSFLIRDDRTNA